MIRVVILTTLALIALASNAEARPIHRSNNFPDGVRSSYGVPEPTIAWTSIDLVSRARAFLGTNPTGWAHVWCGRFMAMIAPSAAAKLRNPNWAKDWLALPHTSARVGAIAVLSRGRRGGHIGVVSGFDVRGNPVIVSGNHGHRVGEGIYPRSRILAFVSAS